MTAYYNEIDPFAAAWLRQLISAGHIAPGDVDERSIADVRPDDLRGYVQCHFFAGIGVWSYALRRAGWADDRPVWTGSCPCQPFSAAGKGGGFDDERHLWPHFYWLISQRRPAVIFGEQVASKAVDPWIDLVHADLEAVDYAFGSIPFPSAGVGAPHIRDRNFWTAARLLANADSTRSSKDARDLGEIRRVSEAQRQPEHGPSLSRGGSVADRLDDDDDTGLEGQRGGHSATFGHGQGSVRPAAETGEFSRLADDQCRNGRGEHGRRVGGTPGTREREVGERLRLDLTDDGSVGGLANDKLQQRQGSPAGSDVSGRRFEEPATSAGLRGDCRPGPTNGFWRDPDWLFCRDDKWRPVRPGTFPLAHGAPARVGRLRGYGNAINAEAATIFIESYLETQVQTIDAERVRLTGAFE